MKRLLIAGAALVLFGASGAAAQDANTSPTGVGSQAATAGGPAPTAYVKHAKRVKPGVNAAKDAMADANAPSNPSSTGTPAAALVDANASATGAVTTASLNSGPGTAAPMQSAGGMSGPTIVGDQSASNPPPGAGAYPPCTKKGQDRCVANAKTSMHHKKMHKTAKKTA